MKAGGRKLPGSRVLPVVDGEDGFHPRGFILRFILGFRAHQECHEVEAVVEAVPVQLVIVSIWFGPHKDMSGAPYRDGCVARTVTKEYRSPRTKSRLGCSNVLVTSVAAGRQHTAQKGRRGIFSK